MLRRRMIPLVARYFFSHVANSHSDARLFLASDKRDTPWPVFTNGIIGLSATIAIATCALDRVRDNGATPDAERAQMTSVCHTHGENYHFKFVNVHAAAIRRKDAVLAGVTFEREDAAASGSVGTREKMMALAIIMIISSLLGEASPRSFAFARLLRFRVFSLGSLLFSRHMYVCARARARVCVCVCHTQREYTCHLLSFSPVSFSTRVPLFL